MKTTLAILVLFCFTAFANLILVTPPQTGDPLLLSSLALELDAAKGNGTGFPGSGCGTSTWTELISSGNATLVNCFTGWAGNGTSTPYNFTFESAHTVYGHGTNSASLNGDVTVEIWLNFTTHNTNFPRLVDIQDATNEVELLYDSTTNWTTKDSKWQGGTTAIAWDGTVANSTWYNIAAVFQPGTSATTFYVNGVSRATMAGGNAGGSAMANTYFLGVRNDLNSVTYFNGLMAIVLVYTRALSQNEVKQNCRHYKSRFSGMTCT